MHNIFSPSSVSSVYNKCSCFSDSPKSSIFVHLQGIFPLSFMFPATERTLNGVYLFCSFPVTVHAWSESSLPLWLRITVWKVLATSPIRIHLSPWVLPLNVNPMLHMQSHPGSESLQICLFSSLINVQALSPWLLVRNLHLSSVSFSFTSQHASDAVSTDKVSMLLLTSYVTYKTILCVYLCKIHVWCAIILPSFPMLPGGLSAFSMSSHA